MVGGDVVELQVVASWVWHLTRVPEQAIGGSGNPMEQGLERDSYGEWRLCCCGLADQRRAGSGTKREYSRLFGVVGGLLDLGTLLEESHRSVYH